MTAFSDHDIKFMREALSLAEEAWGMTSPNPMVGALIVKDGLVVGRGFHRKAGTPHAEINAINSANVPLKGATLYVTLEPCSTYGRTPPCTEAIIKAGFSRVVMAVEDPNPKHAGRAVEILRQNGIEVISGVESEAASKLNESFFKWVSSGRPFVILKLAMTLDGRIAAASGSSKWITGEAARSRVQKLRRWADAVMVGGLTARTDHPSLTVREPENWSRQPRRIIVSKHLKEAELAELIPASVNPPELAAPESPEEWNEYMLRLGSENVTSLLIEGGGELAAEVLRAGIVDKIEFHYAPKLLGGKGSRPGIGGPDPASIADAIDISGINIEKAGCDIIISGYIKGAWKGIL